MKYSWIGKKRSLFSLGGVVLLVVIVASFMVGRSSGGFTTPSNFSVAVNHLSPQPSALKLPGGVPQLANLAVSAPNGTNSIGGAVEANSSSSGQKTQTSDIGPQYLVKTLNVDLQVKDTRKVADDLQTWITKTDPRASTSGTDYEQVSDNLYNISLTFSVQATLYPQVYRYLRDYTEHNGGRLATFNESIQDVTGTYVDTQSRLQNLRLEQGRLQDLLSHAQALSDILSIDQQLTDVEGQIESDEAQLNTLTSQVTFYTVTVSLEPIETAAPPPANNGWSIGQVFHDAFSTSLAFGQRLIGLLVYLVAFGLYIVPAAIIIWLVWRWYIPTRRVSRPKGAMEDTAPVNEEIAEDVVPMNEGTTEYVVPVSEETTEEAVPVDE
ncbi:MAG TPA: DUF4349 domain-containing protein [Ktedonobacteraceae bacterium]